jgi:hypothetical protein
VDGGTTLAPNASATVDGATVTMTRIITAPSIVGPNSRSMASSVPGRRSDRSTITIDRLVGGSGDRSGPWVLEFDTP